MGKLQNKVIVVTGGSGLIGGAILSHAQAEGAIAINAEIDVVTDLGRKVVNCDITDRSSVQAAIDLVLSTYPTIDGWVNCAYPRTADWGSTFENIEDTSWKQNVDMQLNSVFTCCQLISSVMKKQKKGSIVNLASIYGVVGPDFGVYEGTGMTMPAAYAAIKGGVVNFTRYMASYFGPVGIRVNCISPGGIFDQQAERFVKQYEQKVPLRRMGTAADIAPAVSFLLSDEAAYITGHNLMIDGGWTSI